MNFLFGSSVAEAVDRLNGTIRLAGDQTMTFLVDVRLSFLALMLVYLARLLHGEIIVFGTLCYVLAFLNVAWDLPRVRYVVNNYVRPGVKEFYNVHFADTQRCDNRLGKASAFAGLISSGTNCANREFKKRRKMFKFMLKKFAWRWGKSEKQLSSSDYETCISLCREAQSLVGKQCTTAVEWSNLIATFRGAAGYNRFFPAVNNLHQKFLVAESKTTGTLFFAFAGNAIDSAREAFGEGEDTFARAKVEPIVLNFAKQLQLEAIFNVMETFAKGPRASVECYSSETYCVLWIQFGRCRRSHGCAHVGREVSRSLQAVGFPFCWIWRAAFYFRIQYHPVRFPLYC